MKKRLLPLIIFGFIALFSFQRKTESESYWIAVKSYPNSEKQFNYIYNGMTIHFKDDKIELGTAFSEYRKEYDLKVEDQKIILNDTLLCKILAKYEDSLFLDFRESTKVKFIRLDKKHALEKRPEFPIHKNWILSFNDYQREITLTDSLYSNKSTSKICIQKDIKSNRFINTIDEWVFININDNLLFIKTFNHLDDEFYRFKKYVGDSIIELESLEYPNSKAHLKKLPYLSVLKKIEILNKIQNYKWKTDKVIQLETVGTASSNWDSGNIKLESLKNKKLSFGFLSDSTYVIYESGKSIEKGQWKLSPTGKEIVLNYGTNPRDYIDLININPDSLTIGNFRIFEPNEDNYGRSIEMYFKIKVTK